MKKWLLILTISTLNFLSYAQTSFKKGYFITNDGKRTDCLIKDIGWKNNPIEFHYKLSEDTEEKIATIKSVKEFNISGKVRYSSFLVKIDKSTTTVNNMSTVRNPVFNQELLFLKLLVDGKASLYSYEDASIRRYFYKIDSSNIEQLVYKKYRTTTGVILENKRYKQQLLNNFKCASISIKSVERLAYQKKELTDLFIKYNECNNSTSTTFNKNQNKYSFNLTLRPGIKNSSLTIKNSLSNGRDANFGNKLDFRFGAELEFVLPYNNNKWSIIIEPTYQYFKSEAQVLLLSQSANADYKSIEIPVGIRHYFFLNKDSKLFLNVSYVIDFVQNSQIEFETTQNIDVNSSNNFALGAGYNYNSKYSLELRYGLNRDLLDNFVTWRSKYNSLSMIFGYTIN